MSSFRDERPIIKVKDEYQIFLKNLLGSFIIIFQSWLHRLFLQNIFFLIQRSCLGLGNMGKGMAANLVSKGHDVVVYDVNSEAVNDLGEKENKLCDNI